MKGLAWVSGGGSLLVLLVLVRKRKERREEGEWWEGVLETGRIALLVLLRIFCPMIACMILLEPLTVRLRLMSNQRQQQLQAQAASAQGTSLPPIP